MAMAFDSGLAVKLAKALHKEDEDVVGWHNIKWIATSFFLNSDTSLCCGLTRKIIISRPTPHSFVILASDITVISRSRIREVARVIYFVCMLRHLLNPQCHGFTPPFWLLRSTH